MSPQQTLIASIWHDGIHLRLRADHSASIVYPDGSHEIRTDVAAGENQTEPLKNLLTANIALEDLAILFLEEWRERKRTEPRVRLRKQRANWRN